MSELPRGSHYRAALADDDELAELVIDAGIETKGPTHPPLVGWTVEMDALADIQDLIIESMFRGSEKQAPRVPRPVTGLDRAQRRAVSAKHNKVLDKMLPGRH